MENLDRKFDKMLSLQVLDKSKAIAHILQEVRMPENVFCGYHQCHESLVEKSNSVCIKITPYKQPHELSCPLQEEMQKAAFQALQLQKDSVHGYIRKQVCVGGWRWVGSGLNLSLVSAFFYGIDRMELTVNDKLYS